MNWIFSSLLMFLFSILYYLAVKKAQTQGIKKNAYVVANFFIPSILFFLLAYNRDLSFFIQFRVLLMMLGLIVVLNYIGSTVAYVGMKEAPNAGYSLVIQKSYAVWTSIAAIFLFNAHLTIQKAIGILVVLCFGIIVAIDNFKDFFSKNLNWAFYSLIAFFCFGITSLAGKYFVSLGINPIILLFWVNILTLLFSLAGLIKSKEYQSFVLNWRNVLILFLMGVLVTFFYYFKLAGEVTAPNIGYVNAINAASNAFYTVLVALIFHDKISLRKYLGVLGVTLGLFLIVL